MLLLVSVILTAFSQVKAAAIEDDIPVIEQSITKEKNCPVMHYQGDYLIIDYDWYNEPIEINFEDISLSRKERRKKYLFIPPIKYMGVHFRNTA